MNSITKLLHVRVNDNGVEPSVSPIYQLSAFSADSPYFYSRKNNPNVSEFEETICALEESQYGIAVNCGMAAVNIILDILKNGDTLVINKHIYGCSYKLFQRLSEQRGFKLQILDLSIESEIKKITPNTTMVFFETPTNPFLKSINIHKVSEYTKSLNPNSLIVVDNTWATPLFQHPIKHGADISLHSGTKYFSGHSDVMSGIILTNKKDLYEELIQTRFYGGTILSPFNAWLVRRSMQTFEIRIRHHQNTTLELCKFLKTLAQVKKIYYPNVDGVQLTGYGGIIFFELRSDLVTRYKSLTKELKLFDTGTGMACVTSMIAQPYTGSHASMNEEEKKAMGLDHSLVRLCFGLENIEDLKADLKIGLESIDYN